MDVVQRLESGVLFFALAAYILALVFNLLEFARKDKIYQRFSQILMVCGFLGNTAAIGLRVFTSTEVTLFFDMYKFVNTYEFLLAFAWFVVFLQLLLMRKDQVRVSGIFILPIVIVLFIFFIVGGANSNQDLSRVFINRSNWLVAHLLTSALSFGAFALSFSLGVMYIFKDYLGKTNPRGWFAHALPSLDIIDQLEYRFVSHGFPFFTLSIILGAIWSYNAWGRFWLWGQKETWSFISFLAYIAYFHARLLHGWSGKSSAWMAIMGFLAMLFTFVGVNYVLP